MLEVEAKDQGSNSRCERIRFRMEDAAEDQSAIEQELEALSAIYIDELSLDRDEEGQVKEISLLLHPATGDDTTKQFVCMNLVFHLTKEYPEEVPAISIRNPRGLGQEEVSSLVEDMKVKADESVGEVMLYTLIEMAKDSLTDGNIPHCPCIVCLEHFDERSSFHRTACYHYFHSRCLHKYLEHVRAQQAEEVAENAQRNLHHLHNNDDDKEIICPMCRCPLDKETLAVQCAVYDEEEEETFVPSVTLREQQREMAEHFERQKAQGGIIDLEWEKNKYLVNPDDRIFVRTSPQMTSEPNDEDMQPVEFIQQDSSLKETANSDCATKRTSLRPVHSSSSRYRNQKGDYRHDEYRDHHHRDHRGRGYSSRSAGERHRHFQNDWEDEYDEDQTGEQRKRTNQRHHNGEQSSYGCNFDDAVDRHGRPVNNGPSRRYFREGRPSHKDDYWDERSVDTEGSRPADKRSVKRGGGWRDRGRGGRNFREKSSREDGFDESHNPGNNSDRQKADVASRSSESVSSRLREDSGDESSKHIRGGPSEKHSYCYDDTRRNHRQNYASDYHDNKPRRRGRGSNRGQGGGASYDRESSGYTGRGDRRYEEVDRDRDKQERDDRSERGKSHRGKGSSQGWNRSQPPHQDDRHSSHGERYQWRGRREGDGARFRNNRRTNTGRRGADDPDNYGGDVEPAEDEEKERLRDARNIEINQRWRSINSSSKNVPSENKSMPRKFGVVDDNDESEKEDSLKADGHHDNVRANMNYYNGQIDHCYPGFKQVFEEESWEDEVDPYASEQSKYRRDDLKKYFEYKKSTWKYLDDKIKERAEEENAVSEELRRIHKEQGRKQKQGETEGSVEENSVVTKSNGKSILEQFHERQENARSQRPRDDHLEKGELSHNTADAMPERSHPSQKGFSSEGKVKDESDHSHDQSGYASKEVSGNGISEKDISWVGRRPPENFYPRMSSWDPDIDENLIDNDFYEDAWERNCQLDRKVVDSKDSHVRRVHGDRGHHRKKGYNDKDRYYFKDSKNQRENRARLPASRKSQHMKNNITPNGDEASSRTNENTVIAQQEFKRPKPLDMRKANTPSAVSECVGLNDADVNVSDGNSHCDKVPPKSSFKKPKPLDFRKSNACKDSSLRKPLPKLTKDAPS